MKVVPFRAIGAAAAIADGQNTSLLGLLLAAATQRNRYQLLIDAIYLMTGTLTAVSGVGIQLSLRRISALSSGTAGLLRVMNLEEKEAIAALAAQVTCITGGTTTAIDTLGYRAVNNDEILLTGQADVAERCIWRPAREDDPLVINPGQGVDIFQVTASTVGAWIPEIAGRIVLSGGN